jgi:hypothetical protein
MSGTFTTFEVQRMSLFKALNYWHTACHAWLAQKEAHTL